MRRAPLRTGDPPATPRLGVACFVWLATVLPQASISGATVPASAPALASATVQATVQDPGRDPAQDTLPQAAVPSDLATVELARSRECVGVISRVEEVNARLEPIGLLVQRLQLLYQAVVLEDRNIMEQLDQTDALEAEAHAWFVADGRLAQAYLDTQNEDLQHQRTVAREQIKGRIQTAIEGAQGRAVSELEAQGDLSGKVGRCDGAIFIRSAVLEACETQASPVCAKAAAPPDSALPFRFVEAASDLWDVEEIRPWSDPRGLVVGEDGSLGGARSEVLGRRGNVAVSLAFSPLIQQRAELEDSVTVELDMLLDSLGIEFDHPEIIFAPALAIRATLPHALAGEDRYMLHFGPPDTADLIWTAPAGSGTALDDLVVLGPRHLHTLVNGAPLTLTAITVEEDAEGNARPAEVRFLIPLTGANQAGATLALLEYMATQLPRELLQLFPVGGG